MAAEPENLVLQLLRDMRAQIGQIQADITDVRGQMATKSDLAELRSELKSDMHSLRADMAADLLATRKDLGDQIVGLRGAWLPLRRQDRRRLEEPRRVDRLT